VSVNETAREIAGIPDQLEEAARPSKPLARMLAYCLANLGYGMFFAFNNGSLTLWLQRYTADPRLIGLLGGSHSFEGVIIQPIVGAISDRLRLKLGRRRPVMLLFIPSSCLFLALTPFVAHHLAHPLPAIVACIFLFTMSFNVAFDPYQALMVDTTPASQRGRVTALFYLLSAVGQVGVLFLNLPLSAKFVLVAAIMLVTTLVTIAGTPERPAPLEAHEAAERRRDVFRRSLGGLRNLKQVRFYLLMYLFYGAGTDAITPNLTIFVRRITHCSNEAAQHSMTILLLAMGLSMIPCGWLADRLGSKRMLTAGFVLVGLAAVGGLWVQTLPQIAVVMALAGIGTAAQNASAYPLLSRLVPGREVGFYTGLQTAATSIAGPLTILLTGWLILHGGHSGYRMIFVVCGACTILALLFLAAIKPDTGRHEVIDRERELVGESGQVHAL
jgi:maltose/moltooligosaccharide transporter